MQRVANSEPEAVALLYDRFGSLVFRMALQTMPSRQEAEDAVQEIFVRLWRTADRYDPGKAALVTWIMLLSRRHLVDKLRRRRARVKPVAMDDSGFGGASTIENASGGLEADERYRAIMARLGKLPVLQQVVVTRAYLGGQTLRQISEELGTPIGTIKSALSRALVRLRELLQDESLGDAGGPSAPAPSNETGTRPTSPKPSETALPRQEPGAAESPDVPESPGNIVRPRAAQPLPPE